MTQNYASITTGWRRDVSRVPGVSVSSMRGTLNSGIVRQSWVLAEVGTHASGIGTFDGRLWQVIVKSKIAIGVRKVNISFRTLAVLLFRK